MDEKIRDASARYGRLANRVEVGMTILVGLLLAFAIFVAFLVVLARHIARGLGSDAGD